MTTQSAVNLKEKLGLFEEHWSPKIVAALNNYQIKLAKISGEFTWHKHDDTDELFLVLAGEMWITFRDGEVHLKEGDLHVVPKGVEHRPHAREECSIMLIEPAGVVNTGDAGGSQTAPNDVWI